MKSLNNISQESFETIERYLRGEMSTSEKVEFELKLNNNLDLNAQVSDIRDMIEGIEAASLKNKLDDFHSELSTGRSFNPPAKKSAAILKWSIAAVSIAAIGIFWMLSSGNSNKKLFAAHFSPDPGLPTTMSSSSNFEFMDAMVNYKQGDFEIAIQKWEGLMNTEEKNDTLYYFTGVAHLANDNDSRAINYLVQLWDFDQNNFRNETAYYLGLAYLKVDNVADAKKYLTFSNMEDAKRVLAELKD